MHRGLVAVAIPAKDEAERIAACGGEQAVDLAEHAEIDRRGEHEDHRNMTVDRQHQQHRGRRGEGDEHGVLASDVVGDEAEEGPAEPVKDAVERDRKGQSRHLEAEHADGFIRDLEVNRDRRAH